MKGSESGQLNSPVVPPAVEVTTSHRVHFGDCRELLKEIRSDSVQLVLTSPPYWNAKNYGNELQIGYGQSLQEYSESLSDIWKESVRTLLPDGKIAVNIGNIYYDEKGEQRKTTANLTNLVWQQLSSFRELHFMGTIYWEKSTSRNRKVLMGSYPFPSSFLISTAVEAIFVFRKTGRRKIVPERKALSRITRDEFRAYRQPFWRINGIYNGHPAPFPSELPRRLIKMYSFVEDVVMDPFLGSGTTLIEAARLGRNSVGIELNRRYFGMMKKLLQKHSSLLRLATVNFYNSPRRPFYRFVNGRGSNGTN